jgi:EPS-associated MarR family transcriptional regulator
LNNFTQQEISYRLLKLLSRGADLTQRQMAVKMEISLGKVNYCLSELAKKGLIKIKRFKASENKLQYLYHLTPRGLETKANLTVSFLKRKMAQYDEIKHQIQELTREAEEAGLMQRSEDGKLDEVRRLF